MAGKCLMLFGKSKEVKDGRGDGPSVLITPGASLLQDGLPHISTEAKPPRD